MAALIAADLLGQPSEQDKEAVQHRLLDFLARLQAHPTCPPPADDTEAAEREHLGCARCGTGIYAAGHAGHAAGSSIPQVDTRTLDLFGVLHK
jgi:hypothetical protein